MANVKMFAPAGSGGSIVTQFSGVVFVASDGTVTVNAADAPQLIAAGYQFAVSEHRFQLITNPQAASAVSIVASVALTAGLTSLTVAHQADVPRQMQALCFLGTMSMASGPILTLNYVANDGTNQSDVFQLAGAAQTVFTLNSTKGVEYLTSAITSGIPANVAGAGIEIGTTAYLAVPVEPRFVDFTVVSSKYNNNATSTNVWTDGSTTATSTIGGMIAPPNGAISQSNSQIFGFGYNLTYPG